LNTLPSGLLGLLKMIAWKISLLQIRKIKKYYFREMIVVWCTKQRPE
jgi:hypothetical protein